MQQPLIFILAGGEGVRLRPLTEHRSKPAVPFAGRYRLIDVAISNALKKNYTKVYALTQFLNESLDSYITNAYGNKVSILSPTNKTYKGTADSIRKNLQILEESITDHVIILSGDQLYSMDLDEMLQSAINTNADLTIATLPINEEEATRMGVMTIDKSKKITDFIEKPQDEAQLTKFSLSPKQTDIIHVLNERIFLGSMGIYIFKRKALISVLKESKGIDFGMHIIPKQLEKGNTFAYVFDGYWEDIGTIKSYYNANLKLIENRRSLNIFSKESTLITDGSTLPPPIIDHCIIKNTVLTDGCIINAKEISYSLIGLNTKIGKDSILTGVLSLGSLSSKGCTYIGNNCYLEKVIIDENATIEDGVDLSLHGIPYPDGEIGPITIKDGIIIVKKGSTVPKNFSIREEKQRLSA